MIQIIWLIKSVLISLVVLFIYAFFHFITYTYFREELNQFFALEMQPFMFQRYLMFFIVLIIINYVAYKLEVIE